MPTWNSERLFEAVADAAWTTWAQLGLGASRPVTTSWQVAADVEALVVLSLELGRRDARLFTEPLDWLCVNGDLVSPRRLRNVARPVDVDIALVEAAIAWVRRNSPHRWQERPVVLPHRQQARPRFGERNIDPVFAEYGFTVPKVRRSGLSVRPLLDRPVAHALYLRRAVGVGIHAEVLRVVLAENAEPMTLREIAEHAAYTSRNVADVLDGLVETGILTTRLVGRTRLYAVSGNEHPGLLRPARPRLAAYLEIYAFLLLAIRELDRDVRSDYLRASSTLTLLENLDRRWLPGHVALDDAVGTLDSVVERMLEEITPR